MTNVTVIGGHTSLDLAKKISQKIQGKFIKTDLRVFPDGESKITLGSVPKKGKIVIVQSTYPPVDQNLVHLVSIITKAKEISSDITVIVPYMGYARQDRAFLVGEIETVKVIANMIKAAGATKIIIIDIHSTIGLKYFKIKAKNISAIQELANYFKKLNLKDPLVISPDLGGKSRAMDFANHLNANIFTLDKKRDKKTGIVKIITSKLDQVKNRDVIIVDDMISTGGSIVKATEFLKKQKCKRVYVACTHALLINDAQKKIKKAGVTQIISTNTIPGTTSLVDISTIIAQAIV